MVMVASSLCVTLVDFSLNLLYTPKSHLAPAVQLLIWWLLTDESTVCFNVKDSNIYVTTESSRDLLVHCQWDVGIHRLLWVVTAMHIYLYIYLSLCSSAIPVSYLDLIVPSSDFDVSVLPQPTFKMDSNQ